MDRENNEQEATPTKAAGRFSLWLRRSAVAFGTLAAIALAGVGTYRVFHYVEKTSAVCTTPPRVILAHRPAWMSDFVAAQICDLARPQPGYTSLNNQVLKDVKSRLEGNVRANAYIKEIRKLRLAYGRKPGDTLIMDCEFRAPVALVHYQDLYHMVDGEAYYLPETYSADQISKVIFGSDGRLQLRIIDGVQSGPPMPGAKWCGDDVVAAVDMVKVLGGAEVRAFTEDILKVDVANFAQRQEKQDPQIVLFTKYNTQIRWGLPATSNDFLAEIPAQEKLAWLKRFVLKSGRADGRLSWVDLRFDKPRFPENEIQTANLLK